MSDDEILELTEEMASDQDEETSDEETSGEAREKVKTSSAGAPDGESGEKGPEEKEPEQEPEKDEPAKVATAKVPSAPAGTPRPSSPFTLLTQPAGPDEPSEPTTPSEPSPQPEKEDEPEPEEAEPESGDEPQQAEDAEEAGDAEGAEGDDDEILDLGQEYVVGGEVSEEDVGGEPVPLVSGGEAPAEAGPDESGEAAATAEDEREPTAERDQTEEEADPAEEKKDTSHPFDFGTPEMVFDRVEEEREEEEEKDLEPLEEAGPETAETEQEGMEIDLDEAEEVGPATIPVPPSVSLGPGAGRRRPRKRRRRHRKREWWATIFDDDYLAVIPEPSKRELRRDLEMISGSLGLSDGALVLDLACGDGRHAIGMARRNFRVVGVDLSLSMLARAGEKAQEAEQKINFIHGDMRDLGFEKTFDGVYCLGTSFGYFDDSQNVGVIEGVHRSLKPGAPLLIEVANRDHVITRQPTLKWFESDDVVVMEESDFNFINSRLYVSRQLILNGGKRQAKHQYSVRLYSLHEIGQLLHNAGFAVSKISGHPATPGSFFGVVSERLIIVAERRR